MGCSGVKVDESIYEKKKMNVNDAIKNLYEIKAKINNNQNNNYENIYLITAESIPKFLKLVGNSESRNNITNNNNNISNENSDQLLLNYKKEEFQFLVNYVECQRLAEQDIEKKNKFIIVNDSFMENMVISQDSLIKKDVKIEINNNNKRILFNNSDKKIAFKEIDNILYKLVESDDNKSDKNDDNKSDENDDNKSDENKDKFNPPAEQIKINKNENKKIENDNSHENQYEDKKDENEHKKNNDDEKKNNSLK